MLIKEALDPLQTGRVFSTSKVSISLASTRVWLIDYGYMVNRPCLFVSIQDGEASKGPDRPALEMLHSYHPSPLQSLTPAAYINIDLLFQYKTANINT